MNTTKPEHTPTRPENRFAFTSHTSMEAETEVRIAIEVLCENLYPAQQGWGDEMATAIDCLKHHQANIIKAVNAYDENQRTIAELRKALGDIVDANNAYGDVIGGKLLAQALAALERSKP